jgi:GntR family transcriptional regulator
MPNSSMRTSYQRRRGTPVHLNKSVRRTYDMVRSSLHTLDPEARLVEDELTDALSASRATVRAALQLLAQQGLVTRSRKVGTTAVASMVLPVDEIMTVREQGSAFRLHSQVLETLVIPAPAMVQKRLRLPPGSWVAIMESLLLQDTTPLILSASYVGLRSDEHLHPGSEADAIELLEEYLNVSLGETETILAAIECDVESAALLDIPEGSPILWLEDLLYDVDGLPRAICQMRYRGDRVVFSATAHRPTATAS